MTNTETVVIEVPAHLKKWFVGFFSACVEQSFMESYHDVDEAQGDFIDFRYPYFRQADEGCDIKLIELKD